jgi:hypothetical protein
VQGIRARCSWRYSIFPRIQADRSASFLLWASSA